MKKFVVLIVFAIFLVKLQGFVVNHGSSRIVHGKTSSPGQFPFQVLLVGHVTNGQILCGGSLLSNQWILTAAHCAKGVGMFEVHLGAQSLKKYSESGRIILTTNQVIIHEGYYAPHLTNDLALIRLPKQVKFTSRIQPVSLPSTQDTFVNQTVVASGWGLQRSGEQPAKQLQYAELQVLSNAQCSQTYNSDFVKFSTLCAVGLEYQSTCNGDSGGPLILKDTKTLVGVTSFVSSEGCDFGYPDGFTRVSIYLKWIQSKTGIGK